MPSKEATARLDADSLDMKEAERHLRQRLGAFLLRHGNHYSGKSRWTQAHFRLLEGLRFDSAVQQIVFQEYVDAAVQAGQRVTAIEEQMRRALETWSSASSRGRAGLELRHWIRQTLDGIGI